MNTIIITQIAALQLHRRVVLNRESQARDLDPVLLQAIGGLGVDGQQGEFIS